MFIPLIDSLITNHDFNFGAWNDRYGKGIWACLAPNEYLLNDVKESTSDSDLDMIPATNYFMFTDWLPLVTGKTFVEALSNLEALLATLPVDQLSRSSIWFNAVYSALDHLSDVRRQSNEYGSIEGQLDTLPKTWVEASGR